MPSVDSGVVASSVGNTAQEATDYAIAVRLKEDEDEDERDLLGGITSDVVAASGNPSSI